MSAEKIKSLHNAAYDAFQRNDFAAYTVNIKKLLDFTVLILPGNYGDVVHIDHVYRGLFALRSGDVAEARVELLKAGIPPPAAATKTFGPNFMLARELLKIDEREPVLDYCRLVKNFWWILPLRIQFLSRWIREIKAGKNPDFAANLYYGMGMDLERVMRDYPRFDKQLG